MAGTLTPENGMASDRKQINVRLDAATEARMAALIPAVSKSFGLEVNQTDLIRLGMLELTKRFLEVDPAAGLTPKRKKKK